MYKHLLGLLSPEGHNARLSVLIFHRVLVAPDPLYPDEMDARRFDLVCQWLRQWFNVLPLDVAATNLRNGTLPARAACITFDDGYADNCRVALPILQKHGLHATFFVATGYLNGGRMWNDSISEAIRAVRDDHIDLSRIGLASYSLKTWQDRRSAVAAIIAKTKYLMVDHRITLTGQIASLANVRLPNDLMMTSEEVRLLHKAGMLVGGHTVSHPILARMSDDGARSEISDGRRFLEQILDSPVNLFAYPNGKWDTDYSDATVKIVRELGFDAAVSTEWGASAHGDDLFQIRRFTPWDKERLRFGARLMRNLRKR